ncbi:MAG: tRNA preQ1(34) S-adenosylmethionine ribosyltransferase-isomerase QueA [Pseudomonadota bacterium]
MRTDDFDFHLPEELIALRPIEPRDQSRMLVVDPSQAKATQLTDTAVRNLVTLLKPGDALVFNDTRVIPAALKGVRETVRAEGGTAATPTIEINLHKRDALDTWRAFVRPAKRLRKGDVIRFDHPTTMTTGDAQEPLRATITDKGEGGEVSLRFDQSGTELDAAVSRFGTMPLPPYIASRRPSDEDDASTYQTVFANKNGAVAAPTAGLHFTDDLLSRLAERGVHSVGLTLHVGAGTFLPVKAEDTADHDMHAEWGELTPQTADRLNAIRASGGRICAIGTTSLRLLESAADDTGQIQPFAGDTDIFITPGYRFKATDILMTNFHLPRSTLFMLVSAFAGLDMMKAAYAHAIAARYRFYSYGDATLLFPSRSKQSG